MLQKNLVNLTKKLLDNSLFFLVSKNNNCINDDKYFDKFDKNIFYFTNLKIDDLIICFEKKNKKIKKYIFIKKQSEIEKKFNGEISKKEIVKNSFFNKNEIFFQDEIFDKIDFKSKNIYFLNNQKSKENYSNQKNLIQKIKRKNKGLNFLNSFEIIKTLREIKDENEILEIKKSISLTKKCFEKIEKNILDYKNENEIFRDINYILNDNFSYFSFTPIIAKGENSSTLHYTKNNSKIKKDDCILIDFGCEINGYQSDITRTFVKTPFQKKVYSSVLEVQKKVINFLEVGKSFRDCEIYSINLIKDKLIELDLISKKYKNVLVEKDKILLKKIREFYPHSFTHHLGLETHDFGSYDKLKENMIITVELGIYIKNKFGVRIEDNILVKKNKSINLSKLIKK